MCMCEFSIVWFFVCVEFVGFVMCGCVNVRVLYCLALCMCGLCNVWVCVCVSFLLFGFVCV